MATETGKNSATSAMGSTSATAPTIPMAHAEKPGKFGPGVDFKRWQQKMRFYLTTLHLAGCLTENAPVVAENETDIQKRQALD